MNEARRQELIRQHNQLDAWLKRAKSSRHAIPILEEMLSRLAEIDRELFSDDEWAWIEHGDE